MEVSGCTTTKAQRSAQRISMLWSPITARGTQGWKSHTAGTQGRQTQMTFGFDLSLFSSELSWHCCQQEDVVALGIILALGAVTYQKQKYLLPPCGSSAETRTLAHRDKRITFWQIKTRNNKLNPSWREGLDGGYNDLNCFSLAHGWIRSITSASLKKTYSLIRALGPVLTPH